MTDDINITDIIPHSGTAIMIDKIISFDKNNIICETTKHLDQQNPLRFNNKLSTIHIIEFAAQTMAAHQFLSTPTENNNHDKTQDGFLIKASNIILKIDFLDDVPPKIIIKSKLTNQNNTINCYDFIALSLNNNNQQIATGSLVLYIK
ncbi:MAG: hypothetical protein DRQ51_04035 [Gammaproteobacteria bacterium]|nr:MAG: hypothetical protein DRQ51_04035 [Gammaproteobacteria bacterium]